MRLSFLNIFFAATILLSFSVLVSCNKVSVAFDNLNQGGDPDITFYNNYQVNLQTLQLDSFRTSGQSIFSIGYANDPALGTVHAGSYVQFQLPAFNALLNLKNVQFDSLEIVLKSKAYYYGDTTHHLFFKIYPLTQLIQNPIVADDNYYNIRTFGYDQNTQFATDGINIVDSPGTTTSKHISLQSPQGRAFGNDLFQKLLTGDYAVSSQTNFLTYFKGLYIDADTTATQNILYSFGDSLTLRMHYTQHGLTSVQHYLDFQFVSNKQFNHINYNRSGHLPAFPPSVNNVSLLSSSTTNSKGYLSSSTGALIKISFPDLINLKALHPYVKVVSAQLVIPPAPGSFNYPYRLPPTIFLYQTNNNNTLLADILGPSGTAETGNLFIDELTGQNTQYTYDITNFVGSLLNPPVSPNALTPNALILSPQPSLGDQTLSRLIINDQTLIKGIQLKLYVLGI